MTPFLAFRLWLQRAPLAERMMAAAIVLALVGLIGWAAVPVAHPGSGSVTASAGAGGTQSSDRRPASAAVTSVSGPSTGPSSVSSGTVAGAAQAATGSSSAGVSSSVSSGLAPVGVAPGCGAETSTDQGVTARQIAIDVDVADLAGQAGNTAVGLPSAQQEEAIFQAAIDAVNAGGGVRCRKLVAKYYTANALDPPSLQALCLQMVADHPFALLDEGLGSPNGPPGPRDCPPSYKVPEFGSLALSQGELNQYAPYLIGDNSSSEEIVHDWVLAVHQLGWLAGMKKIGLLEQECVPDLNRITLTDLASIGVPSSRITTFDFGCPDAIPPPQEVEQAVLQFKSMGVTHVMDDGGVYENFFSKDAAAQDYKPRYSVGDQGSIALWDNPNFGPDASNFSGAVAITATQYGAENTPGTAFNAATAACDRAMAAKHEPPAEHSPDGFSGVACTLVSLLVNAAQSAPTLRRLDLASGLDRTAHLDLPFPIGPANLAEARGLHGGGYWRVDTWDSACACFRVSRPGFTPSFP